MSHATSPDTPKRVYNWTEEQKQAIRQQAFDRIESPYVARILLKLSRAIWDTYSLHTMDSEDLECGTRLSMCEDIQKALPPAPEEAARKRAWWSRLWGRNRA